MAEPHIEVQPDAAALAAVTAARAVETLGAAVAARGVAHVALTGGSILEAVLAGMRTAPGADTLDWGAVHVWWGDERFVPADSSDRNDLAADAALLDHVALDPAHVHRMPPSDGPDGADLDAACARYTAELAAHAADGGDVPRFDTVLLGIGPDGHCASLFPGAPGVHVLDGPVVAVRNSPKPPPNRLSLTFTGLDAAAEIWFVASGAGKADAVAKAFSGAPREDVPCAGPRGLDRTLWLLDADAAANLPPGAPVG